MPEVSRDAVVQALRTFEMWGGPLRYREEQKWHLRDIMAMRKVLEEFNPDLLAKMDAALAEAKAQARRDAFEEAARVCDFTVYADVAAEHIRALATAPAETEKSETSKSS